MFELLAIAALSIVPQDTVARDGVDTIERNHVYDGDGRLVFTQLILWQGKTVRAWRMDKETQLVPTYDHANHDWALLWMDGDVLRQVRATSYVETWEQYDKEIENRQSLPAEKRRPLKQGKR